MIVVFHMFYLVATLVWNKVKPKLLALQDKKGKTHDGESNSEPAKDKTQLYTLEKSEERIENIQECDYNYDPVSVYDQLSGKLTFLPPLFIQRYLAVMKAISEHVGKVNSVAEFGCAEFSMLTYYKKQPGVSKVLFVDIDKDLLVSKMHRVHPLTFEFLRQRESELSVEVFCGDVSRLDERMRQVDVVVAIELIEHLFPPTLEDVPFNVFGFIQPPLVIITTPNGEFNFLFDDYVEGTFRHDDHKFEWSREQFASWAENIVTRYSNYTVQILGIGSPPAAKSLDQYGHCSQMAVFTRIGPKVNYDIPQPFEPTTYELLKEVIYPMKPPDLRTPEQILFDEMTYLLFTWRLERVPLARLYEHLKSWCSSIDHLKEILERNCRRLVLNEEDHEYYYINDEYTESGDRHYSSDEEENKMLNEQSYESNIQKSLDSTINYTNNWESWDDTPVTQATTNEPKCRDNEEKTEPVIAKESRLKPTIDEAREAAKEINVSKELTSVSENGIQLSKNGDIISLAGEGKVLQEMARVDAKEAEILSNISQKSIAKEVMEGFSKESGRQRREAGENEGAIMQEMSRLSVDSDSDEDRSEEEGHGTEYEDSDEEEEVLRKSELKRLTREMKRVEGEIERLQNEGNESTGDREPKSCSTENRNEDGSASGDAGTFSRENEDELSEETVHSSPFSSGNQSNTFSIRDQSSTSGGGNVHSSTFSSDTTTSSAELDSSLNLSSILMNTPDVSSSGTEMAVSYNLKSHIMEYDESSEDDDYEEEGESCERKEKSKDLKEKTRDGKIDMSSENHTGKTEKHEDCSENTTSYSMKSQGLMENLKQTICTPVKSTVHKLRDITNERPNQLLERKVLVAKKNLTSPVLTSSVFLENERTYTTKLNVEPKKDIVYFETEMSRDTSLNKEIDAVLQTDTSLEKGRMKASDSTESFEVNRSTGVNMDKSLTTEVSLNTEISNILDKMGQLSIHSPSCDRTSDWVNQIPPSAAAGKLSTGEEANSEQSSAIRDKTLLENLSESLSTKCTDDNIRDNIEHRERVTKDCGQERMDGQKEMESLTEDCTPTKNLKQPSNQISTSSKINVTNQASPSDLVSKIEHFSDQIDGVKTTQENKRKTSSQTTERSEENLLSPEQTHSDSVHIPHSQDTDEEDYLSCAESKFDSSDTLSMYSCRSGDTQFESASEYQTSYYSMSDESDSDSDNTLVESDHDTFQNDSSDEENI